MKWFREMWRKVRPPVEEMLPEHKSTRSEFLQVALEVARLERVLRTIVL
jgi:hypothetical protein